MAGEENKMVAEVHALPSTCTGSCHDGTGEQEGMERREFVDVIVSCATATDNVRIRFVDYDEQYTKLRYEMTVHYTSCEAKAVERLEVGELYATLHHGRWLRVRILGECDGGQVECQFVDEGHKSFIAPEALVELKSNLAELPTQAIQCRLYGLVDYADCAGAAEVLSHVLLGKNLVAEVISREDPATVVLFDVSGPEDVDLNLVVFERLLTPCFPPEGQQGRCHLSHVGADGLLAVQMKGFCLSVLYDLMWDVKEHCQNVPCLLEAPAMGTLYACQFRRDGTFRRAVLTSPNPLRSGEFQVRYVDYGYEGTAFLSEFLSLGNFGEFVSRLPYQVLHCRLDGLTEENGLSWSEEASSLLQELIGTKPQLFLKVTRPADDEHVALVELFRRQDGGRSFVSLNGLLSRRLKH